MNEIRINQRFLQSTVYLPLGKLVAYKRNARVHSKAQIRMIADSIETFGFVTPILIDKDYGVVAGHGRLAAAGLLGMAEVPTIMLEHMNETEKRAYILADNRLAEEARWDREMLVLELGDLMTMDTDFSVEVTGFALPAIDFMLQDASAADPDAGDEIPPTPTVPVSRLSDLWVLGDHRVLCGDALMAESYQRLMGDEKAQVVFSDPPYNVPVQGHVSGLGKVRHAEFAMASGEMTDAEFTAFLGKAFGLLAAHSIDGAIHFLCIDWRGLGAMTTAGSAVYSELKNVCIWNKDNGGMGALYRSKHEMVFVYKNGTAPHINNVQLGRHGRYRTNVWNYRSPNALLRQGKADLEAHPTIKPARMIADALQDCSHRGGIVLDSFGGSGSTLIAAENTGRHARLIELEPRYLDVIITRWEKLTGRSAVHAGTGRTFADMREERRHG